jgi:anti-sigma B factor antagonist
MPGSRLLSAPLSATRVTDLGALTIHSEQAGGTSVLSLSGELDIAGVNAVDTEIARIEETIGLQEIVVDLRGLRFIDSTGLRLLIEASRRADTAAHRLRLVRPARSLLRVFEIAAVDTMLPFEDAPGGSDG